MKKTAWALLVVGAFLAGCNDETKDKPAASAAAAAAEPAASAPATPPAAATPVPAAPAKTAAPRVGHRMQLEPVSSDKFKLGPQSGGSK